MKNTYWLQSSFVELGIECSVQSGQQQSKSGIYNMSCRVCSATDTKTDKDKDINRKQERLNPARCLGVVMMLFLRD
ncbi:hypothetical protein ACROYT_G018793 [Oculina patagonica]